MIGATTQEQRSGHLSGTQKLTCIGVHVDAGLAKPVRPRAFCEYIALINVSLHTSVILFCSDLSLFVACACVEII